MARETMETQPGLESMVGLATHAKRPSFPWDTHSEPPGPRASASTIQDSSSSPAASHPPPMMHSSLPGHAGASADIPGNRVHGGQSQSPGKRPVIEEDETPLFVKRTRIASEEGCNNGPETRAFCPSCGTHHPAGSAEHWAAGRVTAETVANSYHGRCTGCGCTWCTNRMPSEWGGGGCLQAWFYRPATHISPAAVHELARTGRQVDGPEHPGTAFRDPAVEARARMWMHCPVCGNELQAIMLQNLPGQKNKWITQWQCPGCVFEAHGTVLRVADYLSSSWMGRA